MTLNEGKIFLERNRIPYHMAQYEGEGDYLRHLTALPNFSMARSCKVAALVIPSVNGVMDIELQFNRRRGVYVFEDLHFGGHCFEMFDTQEEFLEADLLEVIGSIVDGKLAVVRCLDLKRKRWVSGSSFDLREDDNVFGAPGFREAVERIDAPRSFLQKLKGQKFQYDIYDWRTHRQIVK